MSSSLGKSKQATWSKNTHIPEKLFFLHISFNRYLVQKSHNLQKAASVDKKGKRWFRKWKVAFESQTTVHITLR